MSEEKAQQSIWHRYRRDILWIPLASLLWSLLWFIPILRATYTEEKSILGSLYEVFFHQSESEMLVGKGVDLLGSFWMVEQVRAMVMENGGTKLKTMYAPFGFDLGENTGYAWADALLGVPLAEWLGVPGFWNLHVLGVCTLSMMGLTILFRSLSLPLLCALPLAFLCFTNPFMIDELNLGRPTQISIWPLALLIALFIRQQRKGFVPWHGIPVGICMALSCLTYWFTGIAMGVCMGLLFVYLFVRSEHKKQGLAFGLISLCTTFAIVLPITWDMTSRLLKGRGSHSFTKLLGKPDHTYSWFSLDLQTEYSISSWSDAVYVFKASCQLLPFFIAIVVCTLLPQGRRQKWFWFVLWFFTLGMSLSSGLNIFGVHIPTGLAVLEWIFPPMLRCQFEGRNVVVANMIGFVIVGYTLKELLFTGEKTGTRIWWVKHALCVLLWGYALTMLPTQKSLASTKFIPNMALAETLKASPGGVIEFPLFASNYTYVQQIYHKQPIFGGMGFDTVRPSKHVRYARTHPGIKAIKNVYETGYFNRVLSKKERRFFVEDGFPWIVIYPAKNQTPFRTWEHFLGVPGVEISEDVWVFFLDGTTQK